MTHHQPPSHHDSQRAMTIPSYPARGATGGLSTSLGGGDPMAGGGDGSFFALPTAQLWRRKWLILVVFLLVAGASIPAVWQFVEPEYTSRAVIKIAPVVPRFVYKTEDNAMLPLYDAFKNTQVSLIRSPRVLQRVLDRSDVQQTAWYQEKSTPLVGLPPTDIERLAEQLEVQPRVRTELIDISIATTHPKEAATIVNAVVAEYLEVAKSADQETELARLNTVRTQLRTVQSEIDGLNEAKYRIAEKLGTRLPEEIRAQLTMRLNELKSELSKVQMEQNIRAFEIARLELAQQKAGEVATSDETAAQEEVSAAAYASHPLWLRYRSAKEEAEAKLEQARRHFGEEHPTVQSLELEVDLAAKRMRTVEAEVETSNFVLTAPGRGQGEGGALSLAAMKHLYAVEEQRAKELERLINEQLGSVQQAGAFAKELGTTEEELGQKKRLRDDLRERLQVLESERDAPGRISVASLGLVNSTASRDRRLLLTALCLGAAGAFSLFVGYVRSLFDSAIYEVEDMPAASNAPFLGQLPLVADPLAVDDNSVEGAALQENLRMIRTALLQRLPGKGGAVVVTSPEPNAGKSSVAILLARTLSHMGKRVLLIDADIFKATLSQRLGHDERPGLLSVLSRHVQDSDVIARCEAHNLDIMPVGLSASKRDAEMLANGVFSALLKRWKRKYDFVIMDSPPVLSAADARILSSQADGTVMVLRSSRSRRGDVVDAYACLSAAGARLLGTLLVGTRSKSAYGKYGYMYSYTAGSGAGDQRLLA